MCSSAIAGSPRAIAQPVAIPTTEPSCSASTKRRSAGSPASSAISVDPGFAKMVVSPPARSTSNAASRTVRPARRAGVPLGSNSVAVPLKATSWCAQCE